MPRSAKGTEHASATGIARSAKGQARAAANKARPKGKKATVNPRTVVAKRLSDRGMKSAAARVTRRRSY